MKFAGMARCRPITRQARTVCFRTNSFGCPCFDHYVVTPEGRLFLVGNGRSKLEGF
ncbi:hypothetical protein SBA3_3400028 [Candidatus Sulfopaludibacter sp. SbA3]|nr:hypothetical protein SBA3_3400028 [Candidatus Sulfopaludibacter sp. SbA3]